MMDPTTSPSSPDRLTGADPATMPGAEVRSSPLDLFLTATWLGLVTGLIELVLMLTRNHAFGTAALGAVQMNRHCLWMIPVADLVILASFGLMLSLAACIWPRTASRTGAYGLGFLAFLTLLLTVRGLHLAASLLLAAGLAYRIVRRVRKQGIDPRRFIRWSLPVLFGILAVLSVYDLFVRGAPAERRALARLPEAAPEAPNVLLLVLDTVRADHLSLYGYDRETTPNLARLASQGIRFDQARSPAPWTLPSHASLFTGRWPHELDVGETQPLDDSYPTLAEFLAGHGYSTAGFVANTYFCNSWYGLGRGFIHYEDFEQDNIIISFGEMLRCSALGRHIVRLTGTSLRARPGALLYRKDAEQINTNFLRWLSQRPRQRPFFAFLNFIDAHDPYVLPPGDHRHFGLLPESPADQATLQNWHDHSRAKLSAHETTLALDAYDDCIAYLDDQLGRLFAELERRDLLRNTWVIVTADHGEHLGVHDLYGHAVSLYQQEIHVPLVILPPANQRLGRTQAIPTPVSLRDLPATLADQLGLRADSPFPGGSLARYWDPDSAGPPPTALVLSEVDIRDTISSNQNRPPAWRGPMSALTGNSLVYIRNADGLEELYDLRQDPEQTRDLAGSASSAPDLERARRDLARLIDQARTNR